MLEALDLKERLHKTSMLMKSELEVLKVQTDIGKKLEEHASKVQRQMILRESLKYIKKELGMGYDKEGNKDELINKYNQRLIGKTLPMEVKQVYDEECNRLSGLEAQNSEYNVLRNYLDWISILPWGVYSKDRFDISYAERVSLLLKN